MARQRRPGRASPSGRAPGAWPQGDRYGRAPGAWRQGDRYGRVGGGASAVPGAAPEPRAGVAPCVPLVAPRAGPRWEAVAESPLRATLTGEEPPIGNRVP